MSILFLIWLSYCSSYLIRKPLALIKNDLKSALDIETSQLVFLDACFYLPYAGVSIFFGWVADSVGARKVFSGGLMLSALAFAVIPMFMTFFTVACLFFTIGVTQSLGWPSGGSLILPWFPKSRQNFAFGVYGTSVIAGGLAATYIATILIDVVGWQGIFVPLASFSGVLGVFVFFYGYPPKHYDVVIADADVEKTVLAEEPKLMSFFQVIRLPMMLEVCLSHFCIKFIRYAFLLWLPYFFVSALEYSNYQAGMFSSIFDIGCGFGSIFNSKIKMTLFQNDNLKTVTGCSLATAVFLLLFYLTSSLHPAIYLVSLALSGVFLYTAELILCGPISVEVGTKHGAINAVSSVVNGVGSVGSLVQGVIVSLVASMFGWLSIIPMLAGVMLLSAGLVYRLIRTDDSYKPVSLQ